MEFGAHCDWLLSVVYIDEVKSIKNANGSMNFVFMGDERINLQIS